MFLFIYFMFILNFLAKVVNHNKLAKAFLLFFFFKKYVTLSRYVFLLWQRLFRSDFVVRNFSKNIVNS
jgi:hypothetical protein